MLNNISTNNCEAKNWSINWQNYTTHTHFSHTLKLNIKMTDLCKRNPRQWTTHLKAVSHYYLLANHQEHIQQANCHSPPNITAWNMKLQLHDNYSSTTLKALHSVISFRKSSTYFTYIGVSLPEIKMLTVCL